MPINVNNKQITAINCEGREIVRAHAGLSLVWNKQEAVNTDFIMKFNVTGNSLTIPFFNTTGYDCTINWGDGQSSLITSYNSVSRIHPYAANGEYTVSISGICKGIYFNNTGDKLKLIEIIQFGDVGMTSLTNAFCGCTNLKGQLPAIPSSIISIGEYAFYGCNGFTGSLTIPSSVISIGIGAFYSCSSLTGSLTIPSSITLIRDYAFYNCIGFTGSLTIPSSVISIGIFAFTGCIGLNSSLTIPSSVISIGNFAFAFCSNADLYYFIESSTPATLTSSVFQSANAAMRIKVPAAAVATYKAAAGWSTYASIIISQ